METTDILPDFNVNTTFWDRTTYWAELDKDLERYRADLEAASATSEASKTAAWAEASALIAANNKEYSDNLAGYKTELDTINKDYADSIDDRRAQADQLVTNQEDAAWLEANIAAAKANEGWRLSVSQLGSINQDITNQFAVSINNALKDNINFQTDLDTKLADMWLSVIDKKKILDEFQKVLSDEEAAPLLDAIAEKYKTKDVFLAALSDTVKAINEKAVTDSSWRILRSERLEADENAFNAMTDEQKARDIRDRFWEVWNVLTETQKQQIINDTVSWEQSYRETLDQIKNYKAKAETNAAERVQYLGTGADDETKKWLLDYSWASLGDVTSLTKGDKNYTWNTTEEPSQNVASDIDPVDPKETIREYAANNPTSNTVNPPADVPDTPAETVGYKVGSITYTSKADYELLKSQVVALNKMKEEDPVKWEKVTKLIRDKYIIS